MAHCFKFTLTSFEENVSFPYSYDRIRIYAVTILSQKVTLIKTQKVTPIKQLFKNVIVIMPVFSYNHQQHVKPVLRPLF